MNDFIKQNWFKLSVLVVLLIIAFGIYFLVFKNENKKFDPSLVLAKQKCQDASVKWGQENTKSNTDGYDQVERAYFNQNLNACLVDYFYDDWAGHSQVSKVIDIYNGKTLLEYDSELPGAIIPVGEFLYDNGKEIKVPGSVLNEWEKRRAALFEENPKIY